MPALVCATSVLLACHSAGKAPADAAVGGSGEGGSASGGTTLASTGEAGGASGSTLGKGGSLAGGSSGSDGAAAGASGGTGASDGATALNATEVCRAAIQAQCDRDAYCMGYSAPYILRDCRSRADLCPDLEFNADSNRTLAGVAACSDQLAARPCTDPPLFVFPTCLVPGKRPSGAGCAFSSQCQSGICMGSGDGCGTCGASPAVGSKCPDSGLCLLGNYCNPKTKLCTDSSTIAYAAEGQPCDVNASPLVGCAGDLLCIRASYDSTAGTCTRHPAAGAPCASLIGGNGACAAGTECTTSTGGTCELPGTCGVGVRCDATSYCVSGDGGFTCAPYATVGQTCNTSSSDNLPLCLSPAYCKPATGLCARPRALGETCDTSNSCDNPLSCISGTCQKHTASSCPA